MRGLDGFVLEVLMPALFASLFTFGIWSAIRTAWRDRHERSERLRARMPAVIKGSLSLVASLLFVVVMLGVTSTRVFFHYELWKLHPEDVEEIKIGDHAFTDRSSIGHVVGDLKSSEWYSVNHGGWGDETPIVLRMNSGTVWQMRVGYHFSQRGAVVLRSRGPNGTGFALGQIFSSTLPETLDKLGVPLSHCDTAHGKPCKLPST